MKRAKLEDLIKVVSWFAKTEVELGYQMEWKFLLDDLLEVRKQQMSCSMDKEDMR
jgi:hypothetical protein